MQRKTKRTFYAQYILLFLRYLKKYEVNMPEALCHMYILQLV